MLRARRHHLQALLLAGAAPWVRGEPAQPTRVVYPAPESPQDRRFDDMVALLREALSRTEARHGPFFMEPTAGFLNQARQLLELEQGRELRVQWSATTLEKEQRLLPLRFPTRRGLLGYRIALIRRERQDEFRLVRHIEDLRRYSIGQGGAWIDTPIYRAQGFRVETGNYEALFRMLVLGRFDLFPRGLNEVFAEHAARQAELPELAIEDSLALHYPMPYYFFFNRNDTALAARVGEGLLSMQRDGSFEQHFWRFHGESLRKARMHERRLIRLENPFLPPDTPPLNSPLWLDPRIPPPGH